MEYFVVIIKMLLFILKNKIEIYNEELNRNIHLIINVVLVNYNYGKIKLKYMEW